MKSLVALLGLAASLLASPAWAGPPDEPRVLDDIPTIGKPGGELAARGPIVLRSGTAGVDLAGGVTGAGAVGYECGSHADSGNTAADAVAAPAAGPASPRRNRSTTAAGTAERKGLMPEGARLPAAPAGRRPWLPRNPSPPRR